MSLHGTIGPLIAAVAAIAASASAQSQSGYSTVAVTLNGPRYAGNGVCTIGSWFLGSYTADATGEKTCVGDWDKYTCSFDYNYGIVTESDAGLGACVFGLFDGWSSGTLPCLAGLNDVCWEAFVWQVSNLSSGYVILPGPMDIFAVTDCNPWVKAVSSPECCQPIYNQPCYNGGTYSCEGVCSADCDVMNGYACPGGFYNCAGECVPSDSGGGGGGGGGGECDGTGDGERFGPMNRDQGCSEDSECGSGLYCDGGCCQPDAYEDPVLIDLSGTGFLLTDVSRGVRFDLMTDGKPQQTAWTAATSEAGFLALDLNGDGKIDNSSELFSRASLPPGASTHVTAKVFGASTRRLGGNPLLRNGFAALAQYDQPANGGNGDGQIDSHDAIYSRLVVWVDRNHDGVSQTGELYKLADLGISSISLKDQPAQWGDSYGNKFTAMSSIVRNGTVQWIYGVHFVVAK